MNELAQRGKGGAIEFMVGSNSVEFVSRDGRLWITLDHPWYGSSESGFGAELTDDLTPEQTKQLFEWLKDHQT